MSRKICCKCGLPGNQGKDGRWYCDTHFLELKRDPSVDWGAITFNGQKVRKALENKENG